MPLCPSPECAATISVFGPSQPFAYCHTCQHVSFACACGILNSSVARWCRQCGQVVAWGHTMDAWQQRLSLRRGQSYELLAECHLTRVGVRELLAFCQYHGYLVLGTRGAGLLVTNTHSPHTDAFLERFIPADDVLALSPVPVAAEMSAAPQVLVSTSQVLYALHFLPQLHLKTLYTTTRSLLTPALGLPEDFLVCEAHTDGVVIQHIQPETGQVRSSAPLPLAGEILRWLALPQERVLLVTEQTVLVYDVQTGESVGQVSAPAEGLDMAVSPCYDPAQQQVFLGGRQRLWRLALSDTGRPALLRVGETVWQGYQFNVSTDGQEVYVAHSSGISVVDSLTGRTRWSSDTALGMQAVSGLFTPVLAGNALLFGRLNRRGTQDLCFIPLPALNDVVIIDSYTQILHPPLLGPGSLLVSIQRDANVLMQARHV